MSNSQRSRAPSSYTPAASEAGDAYSTGATPQAPQGAPPTYAESVDLGGDYTLSAGARATGDNKIQVDDELGEPSSEDELEDDESDVTLSALVDEDEAAWVLDEYAATHEPPSYEDATNVPDEDELVREIIAGQRAHEQLLSTGTLPCPVIVPQRRPRKQARGFVRAYAPVLQNVGIDQATFLRFLDNFNRATRASPWYTVIEVSSAAAHVAGPAVGFAVNAAIKAATSQPPTPEATSKTNKFLDKMNDELFRPAGVFAFLMKYKTDPSLSGDGAGVYGVMAANINLLTNQVVAKYDRDSGVDSLMNKMQVFRIAEGVPNTSEDLPESAPLIFPEVDAQLARGNGSLKGKASEVLQEYIDRREQLRSARSNSQADLLDTPVETKPKAAEPEQSAWGGGIFGLLSGGAASLQGLVQDRHAARHAARQERKAVRDERRQDRREQRHERALERHHRRLERGVRRFEKSHGKSPSSTSLPIVPPAGLAASRADAEEGSSRRHGRRSRRRGHKPRGTLSKLMTEDVLYLMIVNLPMAEEQENQAGGAGDAIQFI